MTRSHLRYLFILTGYILCHVALNSTVGSNAYADNTDIFNLGGDQPEPPHQAVKPEPKHVPKPKHDEAIENRVNPKKREGKAGSEEAKLDTTEARELYLRRKRKLEQIQAEQKDVSRDQKTLAVKRARMQSRLIDTARTLRHSEKRLSEIEEMLGKTRLKVKEQKAAFDSKSTQMATLISLMQGMGRQPPPLLITHTRDALNMIRSGMVLATFYEDVEKLASTISQELGQLEIAQKNAEAQERKLKQEQDQHTNLKAELDLLLIQNKEQLDTAQSSLQNLEATAKLQLASMKSLEEILPKLDDEVAKQTSLGTYEAELKNGTEGVKKDNVSFQPGAMKPSIPFPKSKGLLPLPVQGKVTTKFGQNDIDGFPAKGMHIETRSGSQVVSPCDGWIIYAGQFRSYGQLLIINAGGGYHILVAGVDRVQANLGQFILAGEPIAIMGSVQMKDDKNVQVNPSLYVEFRKDKQTIDPGPWWSLAVGKG